MSTVANTLPYSLKVIKLNVLPTPAFAYNQQVVNYLR